MKKIISYHNNKGDVKTNKSDSQICKFFEEQHFFITGGNGFIGKLLIEKLLRSTKVAVIYFLMRSKKDKHAHERLEEMLENKALIYVSTAYSNCYLNSIDEKFYDDMNFDYRQIELLLNEPESKEKFSRKILQKWPNTYVFSKAMAELLVKDTAKRLPIEIFRPAIVISTYKKPLEGWTDNFEGITSFIVNMAVGFTRFFCCDVNNTLDIVPGDMTVAALIASAWDVQQHFNERKNIPIYNYVSAADNPITYNEVIKLNINVYSELYPSGKCLWTPTVTTTRKSVLLNFFFDTTYHYIPALLMDAIFLLTFKKPVMLSNYRKWNKIRYLAEYYGLKKWTFENTNVKKLWNNLNETDKEIFPFDMATVHWTHYMHSYIF